MNELDALIRSMPWPGADAPDHEVLLTREWLVTNGLGGYASGTVSGACTRRFHGLLIAATPSPLGRVMMLNHLWEDLRLPDQTRVDLRAEERAEHGLELHTAVHLDEFRLEAGLPVWRYRVGGFLLEKRLFMPYRQNSVFLSYRLLEGQGSLRLKLRPAVHFRRHDAPVSMPLGERYVLTAIEDRYEIDAGNGLPALRLRLCGQRGSFTVENRRLPEILYRVEESRGYDYKGELWSPGHFRVDLSPETPATLVASTESWEVIAAMSCEDALDVERQRRRALLAAAHPMAREGVGAELVLAADQFIVSPAGRLEDAARAHAQGDEVRTMIAGYHWFTDWGRDTMIGLEGLTLTTGRHLEAGYILRTFLHYVRDGLIPNMFPEGEREARYNTADATLWFFHALDRYLDVTGDRLTMELMLPKLIDIIEHHMMGTRFGIRADAGDGLLMQGESGYQLTWMDAKVGDWVVTPRRGKAVEINALWYNALRLMEGWMREEHGEGAARRYGELASRVYRSFNERFWSARLGHLYDVVDGEGGDDPALRPNQIFAISLPHPALAQERWAPVVEIVRRHLLTPVGLRSLASMHRDYRSRYFGDLRARDAAYHQGTVWSWLVGPYVDAWLKVYPERTEEARRLLTGLEEHLSDGCVGSVSEVFDAEDPFTARGCIAQAWGVAEFLRVWLKTRA